jgi:hypothetical protein
MSEVWLRTNARALQLGLVLPLALLLLGLALALGWRTAPAWVAWTGGALALLAGAMVLSLLRLMTLPRLAYRHGHLLVYLRLGAPYQVPIGLVEGFLLGQGPALLPGGRRPRGEARHLTVRLAERAADWAHRDVKPALGRWCGGYITVHGAWCEPLDVALVQRLNQRLAEVSRVPAGS